MKHYTILLAEDEQGTQEELKEILELLFKKVYIASDGLEAKSLYCEYRPDIIITDIEMPKLSGLELVKWIRKKDTHTCIAIVSAHTDVDYLLLATELQLIKYLVKPITKSKLFEVFKYFKEKKESEVICMGDEYFYYTKQCLIQHKEIEYKLTQKESDFLTLLYIKKTVVSYFELGEILELDYNDNAMRQFIKKLRVKLPKDFLRNVQNTGYIIEHQYL